MYLWLRIQSAINMDVILWIYGYYIVDILFKDVETCGSIYYIKRYCCNKYTLVMYNCAIDGCNKNHSVTCLQGGPRCFSSLFILRIATFLFEHSFDFTKSECLLSKLNISVLFLTPLFTFCLLTYG